MPRRFEEKKKFSFLLRSRGGMKDNEHHISHLILSEWKWRGLQMAEEAEIYGCCGGDGNLRDGSIITVIHHPICHFLLPFYAGFIALVFFSLFGCYRFTVITLIQLAFVQVWNVLFEWNRLDGGWFSFDILLRIFWAARILWVSNGFVDLVSIPSSKNILVGLRFLEILLVVYWNLLRFRFIRIVILAYNLNQFSRLLRFF